MEEAVPEDLFDYLFDVGAEKFLSEKEKKYLLELFEKWDPEHLRLDEILMIVKIMISLKNMIRDEGILNLNNDD